MANSPNCERTELIAEDVVLRLREAVRRARILLYIDQVAAANAAARQHHSHGGFAVSPRNSIMNCYRMRARIAEPGLVAGSLEVVLRRSVHLDTDHRGKSQATRQ
jgi:hypothetical protein